MAAIVRIKPPMRECLGNISLSTGQITLRLILSSQLTGAQATYFLWFFLYMALTLWY